MNDSLFLPVSPCHVVQLEKCSQDLGTSTKAVSSAIAQLLSEATQGNENYTGGFSINTLIFCFDHPITSRDVRNISECVLPQNTNINTRKYPINHCNQNMRS